MRNPISYLLVAVIGGFSGWILQNRDTPPPTPATSRKQEKSSAKTTPPAGAELLDAFVEKTNGEKSIPKVGGGDPVIHRFEELRGTMPVSSDPAADFQKRLAEFASQMGAGEPLLTPGARIDELATLGVLLSQWIDLDAKAAFLFMGNGYAKAGESRIVTNVFADKLTTMFLVKRGLAALVDAMGESRNLVGVTQPAVFEYLGKRGSLQDLELLKEKAPAYFSSDEAGTLLGREWPVERREELLAALDPKSAAAAIGGIMGRLPGTTGGDWVLENLKNGGFSEDLQQAMAEGELGEYYSRFKGVTLQQRLDIMAELGTLQKIGADRAKNEMIFNSLRTAFFNSNLEDDVLYSLRHGVMTAGEVVDLVAKQTPDPGNHRGEYTSQMFRTLAEENLPAAMEILSGTSPADQEKQKAYAARWWFREVNPNEFYKLTEELNASGDESVRSMMQDAWNDKANSNLSRFGPAYLEWIKTLPDGANKTLALKSVQNVASGRNARLGVEAGNLLKQNP